MSMVFWNRLDALEKEQLKLLSRIEALEDRIPKPQKVVVDMPIPENGELATALADWARNNPGVRRVKKQG